jgi:transposase-like protein
VAPATAAGASVTGAARRLGVPQKTLDHRVRRHQGRLRPGRGGRPAAAGDDPAALRARVQELERRPARSEQGKEVLKGAAAYFASQSACGSASSATAAAAAATRWG